MEVKTAIPADLPLVEFDAVLMERVLVNLLENAAKYGHESNHSSNRTGQQAFWFPPKRPQSSSKRFGRHPRRRRTHHAPAPAHFA